MDCWAISPPVGGNSRIISRKRFTRSSVGIAQALRPRQKHRKHRSELLSVAPPAAAGRLVQRLDDLIVTWGADRSACRGGRAVVEKLGLPVETEKGDQRTKACFRIGDKLLVHGC